MLSVVVTLWFHMLYDHIYVQFDTMNNHDKLCFDQLESTYFLFGHVSAVMYHVI